MVMARALEIRGLRRRGGEEERCRHVSFSLDLGLASSSCAENGVAEGQDRVYGLRYNICSFPADLPIVRLFALRATEAPLTCAE